jgi:hypothetical protein
MMSKRILVACEESQRVTKQFRVLGYEAYSCDVLDCSGGHPEWHIKGDAIKEAYSGKYDLMIAHPPCTYLSNAGARWLYPKGELNNERYKKGLDAKEFFMKLLNSPIERICVENPLPSKIFNLPNHTQTIQPYQFGEPYSKKTLLWLKNLPLLKHTNIIDDYETYLPSNTGGKKRGQSYRFVSINKIDSSKTFKGIAKAIANQWSKVL